MVIWNAGEPRHALNGAAGRGLSLAVPADLHAQEQWRSAGGPSGVYRGRIVGEPSTAHKYLHVNYNTVP